MKGLKEEEEEEEEEVVEQVVIPKVEEVKPVESKRRATRTSSKNKQPIAT